MDTIDLIFPTVIGKYNDKNICDKILPIAKDILSKKYNTPLDYHSTYNVTDIYEQLYRIDWLREYVLNACYKFIDKCGYYKPKGLDVQMFVSKINKGDYHARHNHDNCQVSGVIYLDVPEGSSPIVFWDPRAIRPHNGMLSKPNLSGKQKFINQFKHVVEPKTGDILMWEGWLQHEVPKSKSNKDRYTLVFNASNVNVEE